MGSFRLKEKCFAKITGFKQLKISRFACRPTRKLACFSYKRVVQTVWILRNVGLKPYEGIGILFQKPAILFLLIMCDQAVFSKKNREYPGKKYRKPALTKADVSEVIALKFMIIRDLKFMLAACNCSAFLFQTVGQFSRHQQSG